MIRTVISDLGRVILWFDNGIFFKKIAARSSCSEEKIREVIHRNSALIRLFDTGKMTPHEFHSHATAKLDAQISSDEFFASYCDVFSLNVPVLNLLQGLKGKFRLILLSNTDPVRFSFIKKTFPEILFFDDYVLSFEVGLMKPDTRIYEVTLKVAASQPSDCVFIDDMEENIEAAKRLGFQSILYKPDTDLARGLRALGVIP